MDYAFHKMQLDYQARHQRGRIFLFGIELTNRWDLAFFRDHDFVELIGAGERFYCDPSLYEFFRIGRVR